MASSDLPNPPRVVPESRCDVAIVGAGAAGLATAIFSRRLNPHAAVLLLDGARSPGAKILVSGGSRCNVTNASVTEADFWGGSPPIVRRVLRAFSVADTVAFFLEMGVALHEETDGKLFPDTNRSRDVLAALMREGDRTGVELRAGQRVVDIRREDGIFTLACSSGSIHTPLVVLATGGQSLPKTGSDGAGYRIAAQLGHSIVPPTPGLAPLLLQDDEAAIHGELTGVSQLVALSIWLDGRLDVRLEGPLLWTHFGVSGPVAMNASRHWHRAQIERRACRVTANFCPGEHFESLDRRYTLLASDRPRSSLQAVLSEMLPASAAAALLRSLRMDGSVALAHFSREERRRLVHALVAWPLAVTDSRGYNYAEVTAGGVPLGEIDPATLESRVCPGLFFAGEILDVDGRIGGFNFQWAWSSAYVVARALAQRVVPRR